MAFVFGHIFANFEQTSPSVSLSAAINAGTILLVSQKFVRLTKFSHNSFRFNE